MKNRIAVHHHVSQHTSSGWENLKTKSNHIYGQTNACTYDHRRPTGSHQDKVPRRIHYHTSSRITGQKNSLAPAWLTPSYPKNLVRGIAKIRGVIGRMTIEIGGRGKRKVWGGKVVYHIEECRQCKYKGIYLV